MFHCCDFDLVSLYSGIVLRGFAIVILLIHLEAHTCYFNKWNRRGLSFIYALSVSPKIDWRLSLCVCVCVKLHHSNSQQLQSHQKHNNGFQWQSTLFYQTIADFPHTKQLFMVFFCCSNSSKGFLDRKYQDKWLVLVHKTSSNASLFTSFFLGFVRIGTRTKKLNANERERGIILFS